MMALTKKTGYALVAMAHLAKLPEGQLASSREIADLFGVPTSLLMNVLKELSAAGYVNSVRGAHGGYRLARDPESITLDELIADLEGPVRMAECISDGVAELDECTCQVMARCPISDPVHRVHRKLKDFLRKVTLAEIVDPAGALAHEG